MTASSVIAQPTSQALVLANGYVYLPPTHPSASVTDNGTLVAYDPSPLFSYSAGGMRYPSYGRNYMYGSYGGQYGGYPQPVYVQPPHQQMMYSVPGYGGYGGMPGMGMGMGMGMQYMPGGASVIVQDPYGHGYRRRSRRHRRHSYAGYPSYY